LIDQALQSLGLLGDRYAEATREELRALEALRALERHDSDTYHSAIERWQAAGRAAGDIRAAIDALLDRMANAAGEVYGDENWPEHAR
jgi:ethanolamine utilization microcompartment shell protein EutL